MSQPALRELYVAELNDIYAAEHLVLHELPLLAAAADAIELRDVFDTHYTRTLVHVERVETLFRHLEERPRVVRCRALSAIIEDGRQRKALFPAGGAVDAALIATGRRIAQHEIAAYRGAYTYALALADAVGVEIIGSTLAEEEYIDERLTALGVTGSLPAASHLAAPRVVPPLVAAKLVSQ